MPYLSKLNKLQQHCQCCAILLSLQVLPVNPSKGMQLRLEVRVCWPKLTLSVGHVRSINTHQ